MRDFFISYAGGDKKWAEWIAWTLEESGYSVVLSTRDSNFGDSFVQQTHLALQESRRIIVVLSSAYLESKWTEPELAAAFAHDPTGKSRILVPIRIEPVEPSGFLLASVYVDLFGVSEQRAKEILLRAILGQSRAKPTAEPPFPEHVSVRHEPLSYPGTSAVHDPPDIFPYIDQFRKLHADARKNAFIMMRFGEGRRHQGIADAIIRALIAHGINAHRADDIAYAEYLMANVRTYMHGCGFGVAVFERIESETHNPNVALEVGYMIALGKRVCLLKDKTLKHLPTDIMGSLYSEFDTDDLDASIQAALSRWLRQRGLTEA